MSRSKVNNSHLRSCKFKEGDLVVMEDDERLERFNMQKGDIGIVLSISDDMLCVKIPRLGCDFPYFTRRFRHATKLEKALL